jgi:alcohol dehydrogenase
VSVAPAGRPRRDRGGRRPRPPRRPVRVEWGFEVVAIARGEEKGPPAKELGAHHYIDSTTSDVAEELTMLGGACWSAARGADRVDVGHEVVGDDAGARLVVARGLALNPIASIPMLSLRKT